jgi:hypothetical protein
VRDTSLMLGDVCDECWRSGYFCRKTRITGYDGRRKYQVYLVVLWNVCSNRRLFFCSLSLSLLRLVVLVKVPMYYSSSSLDDVDLVCTCHVTYPTPGCDVDGFDFFIVVKIASSFSSVRTYTLPVRYTVHGTL